MLTRSKKAKIRRELIHSLKISIILIVCIDCIIFACLVVLVLPWPPSEDCRDIMKIANVWQSLEMLEEQYDKKTRDGHCTQKEHTRLA